MAHLPLRETSQALGVRHSMLVPTHSAAFTRSQTAQSFQKFMARPLPHMPKLCPMSTNAGQDPIPTSPWVQLATSLPILKMLTRFLPCRRRQSTRRLGEKAVAVAEARTTAVQLGLLVVLYAVRKEVATAQGIFQVP